MFRTVIAQNGFGFATPLDDLVQDANDAFGRQREINLNGRASAIKIDVAIEIYENFQ